MPVAASALVPANPGADGRGCAGMLFRPEGTEADASLRALRLTFLSDKFTSNERHLPGEWGHPYCGDEPERSGGMPVGGGKGFLG